MTATDKPRFVQAFARLALALRENDPDGTTMRVYFEGLQSFEIEIVCAAAERLLRGSWFPKLGEWGRAANAVERERREAQQAFLRKLPTPLCAECGDTGWRLVDKRAHRCSCQELRRLELLGRRPWPTLPSAAATKGTVTDEQQGLSAR